MTELLTAEQMRAVEKAAIDSGEVTGLELMERAGRGVVEAILDWRPELATAPRRAVVICGPGNNGGDGFVVARLLRERAWEVEVLLYGDEAKLPPDAAENARRWREMGDVKPYVDEEFHLPPEDWQAGSLIVDALFGTGLTRPVEGFDAFGWSTRMSGCRVDDRPSGYPNCPGACVVAVDIPSGLCADSGRYLRSEDSDTQREHIRADLTVTFHSRKLGHVLEDGPDGCGEIRIADIGLGARDVPGVVVEMARASGQLKKSRSHKYDYGHALILAGGAGKGGAARLAARGALRIGAGLVTVCAPPEAIPENAAQLNAIMLRPVADAEALAETLKDKRLNAIGLGPGLGAGERTRGLVTAALEAVRGTVLDADALTSFADDPAALFALLHETCVLTPHMGEFARLFPDIADKLKAPAEKGPAYSKVDAAREAAARAGCTVLLKGPDSVIADWEGRAAINSARYERAAPWLATAGAGDVLAGMIAGLLARGFGAPAAAETAAWLHVEAARRFGPGLIAEDLPEMLPAVFRDLGF